MLTLANGLKVTGHLSQAVAPGPLNNTPYAWNVGGLGRWPLYDEIFVHIPP